MAVETLPLWSTYAQQLVLMTVHTPCKAKSRSRAILFCITNCGKLVTSCMAKRASIVQFPMLSVVVEILTNVFSDSLTLSQGKNPLTKLKSGGLLSCGIYDSFGTYHIAS